MSLQACNVIGIGYKFPYGKKLPSISKDVDQSDFLYEFGLCGCYYKLRDLKNSNGEISPVLVFDDGMDGEYCIVMVVTEASYVENTHGDDLWRNKYRNDDYVKKSAQSRLELLLGKMSEAPQEISFNYYQ